MKNKDTVSDITKQKKRSSKKASFLMILFLLTACLPALTAFVLMTVFSEGWKNFIASEPYIALVPFAVLLVGAAVILITCGLTYKKRCKELTVRADEMIEGKSAKEKFICADKDEMKVVEKLDALSQQLALLRAGNSDLTEKSEELRAECDSLRFSLLTAKSGPMLLTRAMEKLNKIAEKGDKEKLAELTETITEIMKTTMLDGHTLVPLARELELIKGYIDVNDAVTGEKTNYRMSIMCNIVSYRIIPHIVFPVIESFFESANRSGVERYEIGVEVTSSSKNMLVIVRDNGAGLSQSTLEQIQSEIDSDIVDVDSSSISLPNINRRLKLYYGAPYGLKVSSSKLGTVVRIYLPAKGNDF